MGPGPFDITYDQIMQLGPRFTGFVNKLLQVEVADHGIAGHQLTITHNEDAADGGVDAALRGAPGTGWLPAGDTALQFKRSSQSAADCAKELAKSTYAQTIIKAGGHYVMVLGSDGVPDQNLRDREEALANKAIELQLIAPTEGNRIKVYGADDLARWASEFTALAVDPVLGSLNPGAIDYQRWRGSRSHVYPYAPDPKRTGQIDDLRSRLAQNALVDVRLQGYSGYGKTRLAMEALDDPRFRSLVAYIPDAAEIGGGLIESLIDRGRHVILVIDECPAPKHVKLVERLDTNPAVKLITIGDVGTARSSGPAFAVDPLSSEAVDDLLTYFPALWPEARRFVRDHSHGVPAYAIWLAQAVVRAPHAHAGELIARDDITTFVTNYLPEGTDFFFAAVLALFERVGWDRDLRPQMELLAAFAGTTPAHLDALLLRLTSQDLVRAQGRYRAIDPLPVAIYLATEGWRHYSSRIVSDLLPKLPDEMVLALFRRLGQLGQLEPATSVLPGLLEADGPFGDLERIDERNVGQLLTQLAIVLPHEVAAHLSLLIGSASLDQLRRFTQSRRDLVWTLEKLVWHTRTFETAANALLRLALAETESYANNATGTWLDLFGSTLPGTAAPPTQRADYLEIAAQSTVPDVRRLAVQATEKGLRPHESIMVSGEIQGGVLVEPRGTAASWVDVGDYRRRLLGILDRLRNDPDPTVAKLAVKALRDAVHPMLDDPFVGDDLTRILATFRGDDLNELRVDIEHLANLHRRHDSDDNKKVRFLDAVDRLRSRLPTLAVDDELEVMLHLRSFDLEEGQLQERVTAAMRRLDNGQRLAVVTHLDAELPAALELGQALAKTSGHSDRLLAGLASRFGLNPSALVGYLAGLVDRGDEAAFDDFLDGPIATSLSIREQVSIAVRGPVTQRSRSRILNGINTLRVRDAAAVLFGWGRHLDAETVAALIRRWTSRLDDQHDYNAAVDWVNITFAKDALPAELVEPVWDLLRLRPSYLQLGHQQWDWARLAGRYVEQRATDILHLFFDLIENPDAMVHSLDDDSALIRACLQEAPEAGWADLGTRLQGPEGWRFQILLRGWVQSSVPIAVLDEWIGGSLERGRVVASITEPGADEPTELANYLLERFEDDEQIWSSLRASFVSGAWVGAWSSRIAGQIDQLRGWTSNPDLPVGVRRWASDMINKLTLERQAAEEREAERDY